MRIRNRKLLFASAAAMLLCMLSAALILHINVFAEVQTQTFRPIVALVNFADSETPFTEENRGEFETIFNSTEGGTDEHNLQSYLRTLSRGKIDYQSQFVVITLDRETSFYQNWNGSGLENIFTDAVADDELIEFVAQADADANGDGMLDGLTFYVNAETADPAKGAADAFWPHQSTNSVAHELGGYEVSRYMVVPRSIEGAEDSGFLQVICHETLHMFGADDLYHYANTVTGHESNPSGYEDLYPVGIWDIMGNPQGYDAPISVNTYYRYCAGFLDDTAFVTAEPGREYEIRPALSQSGVIGLRFGEKSINGCTEFFVLEYRDLGESYDQNLTAAGGISSGYTLYRVRENGTGNRLARNGDEIVYFDEDLSDDLSLRRSIRFAATFRAPSVLSGFCYSDGTECDYEVDLSGSGATVEAIEQNFRIEVMFGSEALTGFTVRCGDEILTPSDSGIYTAPRGSEITVTAEGYVLPEGTFTLTEDSAETTLAAYRQKTVVFSEGESGVAQITGTVRGTDRVYLSDAEGVMQVLLAPDETVDFTAYGYEFSVASYTLSEDLSALAVSLTAADRTITVTFTGTEVSGTVLVSVNGGESREMTVTEGSISLPGVRNGDRILITQTDHEFAEVIVSHLIADGDYTCEAGAPLLQLPAWLLAIPAALFVLIAIAVFSHDYRKKK